MSFDLNGLSEVRALNFGRRYHAYDTTDTLSAVLTAGYFDAGWYRLGARDRLDIEASDGRIMAVVSAASAAGVTITASTDVIPANALAPGSVARSVEDAILWMFEVTGSNGMTLAQLHHRSLIVMPAGTLNVPSAATLGAGWWCSVIATGAVTISGGGTASIETNDLVTIMVAGGHVRVSPAVPMTVLS